MPTPKAPKKKKSLKPVPKVQAGIAGNAGGAALVVIVKAVTGWDMPEEIAGAVIVLCGFAAAWFKKS